MTFCAAWAEGSANDWLALMLADERGASGARGRYRLRGVRGSDDRGPARGDDGVVSRLGRVPTLRWGALVTAAGIVVLLAVPVLAVGYLGALLWGLGIAVAFPLAMSAAGETPGRGPSAIATVATIAYTGFLVGPPLIGTIAHQVGLESALWLVLALAAGIFVLAGTARDPRRVRG